MLAFLALPTYANDNAYSARLIRNRLTGEPGTIRASGPWERENHRLRLRPDRSLAGCQPAKRAGNPPRQRADTLSKASTWPLLAAMNRSRYSHGKARKGALIFVDNA